MLLTKCGSIASQLSYLFNYHLCFIRLLAVHMCVRAQMAPIAHELQKSPPVVLILFLTLYIHSGPHS